ncbi:conserved Plasmodium protein, unknown function [Plasmodium vivax]|uniref:Ion transport domain-containing protein n=2 Tax=Plasmodium vivax TaxID=5855 RepID=A0A1G4HIX1_PLAVI|nr:hypothetical protein PVNG_03916 [Plasmodium vivax North Korean]SCO74782.1 conserved Plasmodium protein, unknown function [Plasmodium vivax]VUZ98255.1 conserved protein, unknown function [Plasmodium vivax]
MDTFIDEEINGSEENEAVLLEIDDLLDFKDPPPQRGNGREKRKEKEKGKEKRERGGTNYTQGGAQSGKHNGKHNGKHDGKHDDRTNGQPNQAERYPPWGGRTVKVTHRDRQDFTDDANEWLIKKGDLGGDHHGDDLEDHLTHHEGEADALAAKRGGQNTHSGKAKSKYHPPCSYPLIANMYGRAKCLCLDVVNGVADKFTGNIKRGDGLFYKSHSSFDFLHILANRLYYSRGTMYLYFFVIILNLFILVYTACTRMVSLFVVLLEIFVILMLVLEVCLRLATQGRSYFHNFDGLFDVTVTTMCFLLLISSGDLKVFYQAEIVKTKNKEVEEIISQSLTVLRFSFQLFRTLTLFMHYERVKAPSENIDFSVLNLPHEEEEEEEEDFVI